MIAEDAAWRKEKVEQRPVLGRLTVALRPKPTIGPEPQHTTAWKTGAEGEERVAEVLAGVPGIEVLHDRRVPRSRANIDHLVVGPAGVYVIDAKKYKKGDPVQARNVGTRRHPDERLYVGDRNRTKLVESMQWQIEVLRTALGDDLATVPVHGVLCFVGASWGLPKRTRIVRGVTALWPLELPRHVSRPGPGSEWIPHVAAHLREALPPAVS